MKVLLSPDLNQKLQTIPQSSLSRLANFVKETESLTKNEFFEKNRDSISELAENIYSAKIDSGRLYLTLGKQNEEDYLLLMDFALTKANHSTGLSYFSSNSPRSNRALDPSTNASINPNSNASLNPKLNATINPKFNATINPKFNATINPKFNATINPKFNSTINPRFNYSINPKMNLSLNPKSNLSYNGPFIYNLGLDQVGYIVRANDQVDLIFNKDAEFEGFLVSANEQVKVRFDTENNFSGYFVKANDMIWLWYSPSSQWLGSLI